MSGYAGIDTALLMRHDRPGPRYTSYPTAPVWTEAFGEKEWAQAMARANEKSDEPFSLYVHIPYCRSMCLYCGCSVIITRNLDKARSYVDLVIEEARRLARELPDRRRIQQHHWGGGTPTYLPPDELAKLYRGIAELFPPDPEAEIGIEVDPSVTTLTQLGVLRELGFNRISMGIQDFTPEVQEAVHRIQGVEATEDLIREARRLGFESVNVDLICGLPHQEPESFGRTIDQVIEWRIDRVACYSFAYVPWLKKHQKALPEASLPDRERKFQLFTTALAKFGSAGYVAIGLDHFARPEDSLAVAAGAGRLHRNFMGYTTRMGQGRQAEDMLPLGVTSIGEVQGSFGHNLKERRDWQRRVEEGRLPVHRGHRRSEDDEERRRIILDLMCAFRVDYADFDRPGLPGFEERYAAAIAELAPLAGDGLVEIDASGISVTERGRIFLRNICMPFDAYLKEQQADGKPMFSRTV